MDTDWIAHSTDNSSESDAESDTDLVAESVAESQDEESDAGAWMTGETRLHDDILHRCLYDLSIAESIEYIRDTILSCPSSSVKVRMHAEDNSCEENSITQTTEDPSCEVGSTKPGSDDESLTFLNTVDTC